MKGVRDVQKNVDRILDAFKIIEFADTPIKKLSGGTRRKLMCSIALIGKVARNCDQSIY